MNENKIDCRGLIQHSHGLNGDFNYECGNRSCQYFDTRQAWNIGTCTHPLAMGGGGGAQHPPPQIGPSKSLATIMSRFESPASAFYAAELCMGFAEYDCQGGNHSQFSKMNDLDFPLYQSPRENIFLDSANQPEPSFELSNTLQAMVKSQLNGNQCCRSPQRSNKITCGNFPGSKFMPIEQQMLLTDGAAASVSTRSSFPNKANQEHIVSFSSHQDKSPTLSAGSVSGNPASYGVSVSSKTRIRWTQDLHEKFVECVNRLGGADKATPKAILKMMDSDGLTIFHVKSHLQKYRIAKYMPESSQGKSDKRIHVEDVQHLDVKTGLQIREALQLQLDTQRRLHEQLEIQRKLQLRIEEQGRQLKRMFDQQQMTTNSLLNCQNTANDEGVGVSISERS